MFKTLLCVCLVFCLVAADPQGSAMGIYHHEQCTGAPFAYYFTRLGCTSSFMGSQITSCSGGTLTTEEFSDTATCNTTGVKTTLKLDTCTGYPGGEVLELYAKAECPTALPFIGGGIEVLEYADKVGCTGDYDGAIIYRSGACMSLGFASVEMSCSGSSITEKMYTNSQDCSGHANMTFSMDMGDQCLEGQKMRCLGLLSPTGSIVLYTVLPIVVVSIGAIAAYLYYKKRRQSKHIMLEDSSDGNVQESNYTSMY